MLCRAQAQAAPAYAAPADTGFVESVNPHFMYWIVKGDTLGTPIEPVSLERQFWRPAGEHLRVSVRQQRLLPERSASIDSFLLQPNGRLAAINGRPRARMDGYRAVRDDRQ